MRRPHPGRWSRARPVAITVLLTSLLGACASSPAAHRAALIADADRNAKEALAAEARLDVARIPDRTLAVVPFVVASEDTLLTPIGFGLADLLATDLSVSSQLQILDRLRIDAVLRELHLVDTGVSDEAATSRTGKLLGARRLLIGSIANGAGGAVQLRARVVNVVDGTVENLVAAEAPLSRIIDAEKALALLIFERLGVALTPAQRAAIEQRRSTQLATLLAFGRGAQAEAHGDAAAAAASFAEATRLDAAWSASQSRVGAAPGTSTRASSVQRVLSLSTGALNQPVAAHVSEAADAALTSSLSVGVVITIRVTP